MLLLATAPCAFSAADWVQGSNYYLLRPALPTSVAPGKVQVTEVFSYAFPACNRFYPVMDRLRVALPANAELTFVAAAFRTDEDWPMFQRAFYTAQILEIDRKTHDAMFDAVWKTGELAVFDPRTQRIKVPAPGLQDAARFYARAAAATQAALMLAGGRAFARLEASVGVARLEGPQLGVEFVGQLFQLVHFDIIAPAVFLREPGTNGAG